MSAIKPVQPALLFCGIISVNDGPLRTRTRDELVRLFGPVHSESPIFAFTMTDYYAQEMGSNLVRTFTSFSDPFDPERLAEIKIATNRLEESLASAFASLGVQRPVNLDPGYITPAKLVLATTKDFSHRICIGKGIYAEVTLNFTRTGCRFFEWTYPDFKSGISTPWFLEQRRHLMERESG